MPPVKKESPGRNASSARNKSPAATGELPEPTPEQIEEEIRQELRIEETYPSREMTLELIFTRHSAYDESNPWPTDAKKDACKRLTHMRLDRQRLSSTPAEAMGLLTNVANLYLQHNRLTKLEHLNLLPQLRFLTVAYNQITKVEGLSDLPKLMFFDISYNKVARLSPVDLPSSLRFLQIEGNPCSDPASSTAARTRAELITALPNLRQIDKPLTKKDHQEARQILGLPPDDDAASATEDEGGDDDEDDEPEEEGEVDRVLGLLEELERSSARTAQESMARHLKALSDMTTPLFQRSSSTSSSGRMGGIRAPSPSSGSRPSSRSSNNSGLEGVPTGSSRPPSANPLARRPAVADVDQAVAADLVQMEERLVQLLALAPATSGSGQQGSGGGSALQAASSDARQAAKGQLDSYMAAASLRLSQQRELEGTLTSAIATMKHVDYSGIKAAHLKARTAAQQQLLAQHQQALAANPQLALVSAAAATGGGAVVRQPSPRTSLTGPTKPTSPPLVGGPPVTGPGLASPPLSTGMGGPARGSPAKAASPAAATAATATAKTAASSSARTAIKSPPAPAAKADDDDDDEISIDFGNAFRSKLPPGL